MSAIIEKQVQIADHRAKRLEYLAATRGTTENALIEEALDLLFREQATEEMLREDWELLRQMEAELGPVPPVSTLPIQPEQTTFIVGTPILPERIRRRGEGY